MKRIITLIMLYACVIVVLGAVKTDSISVFFAVNSAKYDPLHNNNAESMKKFIDGLAIAAKSGNLDHIEVFGYASPDGSRSLNERLSRERCDAIAEYISLHAGVPMDSIHTFPGSVAWEGLRDLVVGNPDTPSRDKVLAVLDKFLDKGSSEKLSYGRCKRSLQAIDYGHAYKWMLENLFPELRSSLAVYAYTTAGNVIAHPILEPLEFNPELVLEEDVEVSVPSSIDYVNPALQRPLHRLALKTNLLYYAALFPNLELEWLVNDKWSVSLEGDMAWWGKYSDNKIYRLVMFSPEVRRWINPSAPWHGLYAGAFAGGGYYDFEWNERGHRGEGVMAGVSVGYMWPVSRCLSLEAGIGAGYLFTRCKDYKPIDGCNVYQRTKNISYFGPLKVKFSLVWRFWDLNRFRRRCTQNRSMCAI